MRSGPFAAAFLHRLLLAAAILALFLPLLGPLLDHHAAERHPHHAHVYLSHDAGHHVHFYEEAQPHHHGGSGAALNPAFGEETGNAGVVYLEPRDGWALGGASVVSPNLHMEIVYPVPDDNFSVRGFHQEDQRPPEALVSPPRRPPRS